MTAGEYRRGALYGIAAASIWSGWIVVARLGLRTSLTPWDIAVLRFGVGGVLLLPYVLRKGLAIDRLGWTGLATLVIGCGAPMVLLVNAGLLFAPAAHAGSLFSGTVPLFVALLAVPILRESFTPGRLAGFAAISAGALVFYGRAVGILGASGGAAFPALCPAMTAVLAIPILGEWPGWIGWVCIVSISAGVYAVSGGPLPWSTRPIDGRKA